MLALGLFTTTRSFADEPISGEKLFATRCANCHGPMGEGSADNKRRLEGDRSVAQLADVIGKTMPEDAPGTLSPEESKAVASYIHEAFYSPIARERNRPARIELSRLTARQYRHCVADLVGGFRWQPTWGEQRGLHGDYFSGRRLGGRKNRAAERVDASIQFNFGTDAPVPEITEPHEFSIRWEGSCLAPETGEYELVVRTEHSVRLWLNDKQRPLIDAWVKSGSDTEYRAPLFLIAGRIYPIKLEYTKAKQGVDDSKNQKEKPASKPSSITLAWKRPTSGAVEPIAARYLSTADAPESFLCATPFPPDDRSYGWERGNAVSKSWDQATTNAAIETADYVAARIDELAGTKEDAPDRKDKVKQFCRNFADRAFRRPLTDEQFQQLVAKQFERGDDLPGAVRRVVVRVLKFPQFLYREFGAKNEPHDVAARLAFALWDALPDAPLREAAAAGQLANREQLAQHADRMLADPRAKQKLRDFLLVWVKADQPAELIKDKQLYPEFDESLVADLRTSLELFLDDVVWSGSSDYRRLLTADELYLNDRLGKFYGVEIPPGGDFQSVRRDADRRAGVLTHPYLMSRLARTNESSPIHRGVFLARGILGRMLKPPPEAVTPLPVDVHPELSTRERVTLQTEAQACATCHAIINPLGFTLENFDAVGRFRDLDRGKPVNAAGEYHTRTGEVVEMIGSQELAKFLVGSDEPSASFTTQLFHHLIQQSPSAYGPQIHSNLTTAFAANGYSIRRLVTDIAVTTANRELEPRSGSQEQAGAAGR